MSGIQINPVLIGFLSSIPIYLIGHSIYSRKIKPKKERREIERFKLKQEALESLNTEDFKELKQWIRETQKKGDKDKKIIKILRQNGWHILVIQEALDLIKEEKYYAKQKTKTKIPDKLWEKTSGKRIKGFRPKNRHQEEVGIPKPISRDYKGTNESISRDGDGDGSSAEFRIPSFSRDGVRRRVQADTPRHKQKSKWDWNNLK
jgi:hypothetical protein